MNCIDWDDVFANATYIKDGTSYPDRWRRSAAAFIATHESMDLDVSYGAHARQKLDVFWPASDAKGLVCFVHGGYWLDFDKSYWSHLAEGANTDGWVVAIPSYVLAPEVRISDISRMIARAIEHCCEQVDGPIILTGHSAGGHLVTRMVCENSKLSACTRARIARVVSISGLHDLRNLRHTKMNEQLQLELDEAIEESPALQEPISSARVICWVGSHERPEFLSQATTLCDAWKNKLADIQLVVEPGRHHFNVIASLTNPESSLTRTVVGID